jgi:hypothetical protein
MPGLIISTVNFFLGQVILAKTKLIEHYSVTLGALLFSNNKMVIPEKNAYLLVCKYFAHEKK